MSSPVRGNFAEGVDFAGPAVAGQTSNEIENVIIMGDVVTDDQVLFWVLAGQLVAVYHAVEQGECEVSLIRVRPVTGQTNIGLYSVIAGSSGRIALDPPVDLQTGDRLYVWVTDATGARDLQFGCELSH